MAKKSKTKSLLHLDPSTGSYSGEVQLDGILVPVEVTPDDEAASIAELEKYLETFVHDWDQTRKKVLTACQKELRATGYLSSKSLLTENTLSIFSLNVAFDGSSWFFSLGIEFPELLSDDDYVDYSSDFDGEWHTTELSSLI